VSRSPKSRLVLPLDEILFHGTMRAFEPEIKLFGLVPQVGAFVEDAYGLDEKEAGEPLLTELVYAASFRDLSNTLTAAQAQIALAKKVDFHNVACCDRREALVIAVPRFQFRWASGKDCDYGRCPFGVEPGDWYSDERVTPIAYFAGANLDRLLETYKKWSSRELSARMAIPRPKRWEQEQPLVQVPYAIDAMGRAVAKRRAKLVLSEGDCPTCDESCPRYGVRLAPWAEPCRGTKAKKPTRPNPYWGTAGAGILFLAQDTGRLLFPLRSSEVYEPGTWGVWGGRIEEGEDPKEAAVREANEEMGADISPDDLVPLMIFRDPPHFVFYNFLAVVPHEFDPDLQWETEDFKWVGYGSWPQPLHPKVKLLLKDKKSLATIRKYLP
jgi:8-oxo-dGTP pyrophosphatase MutT (NUDIX family)